MCTDVAVAMEKATRALLETDLQLAEQVISEDLQIDTIRDAAEERAFALLALQAPVATDLRIVVAAIHGAGDIERMGDLALHVAQAARRRHPQPVLPTEIAPYFAEMGRVGVALATKAGEVIRSRDIEAAAALEAEDDAMDDLHKHMFTVLMDRNWTHGVEAAVDVTLLARFYERYADHAVAVARRIVYVVTGRMPGPLTV
jgi:phosphate transport system protein